MSKQSDEILLLGIGNPLRGDDGIGNAVVRAMAGELPSFVHSAMTSGETAGLMAAWKDYSRVIAIDAVVTGSSPGTLFRFDAGEAALPASFFHCSTHSLGLGESIELARALGEMPKQLIVIGIEGDQFELGSGLSAKVQAAIPKAIAAIRSECHRLASEMHSPPYPQNAPKKSSLSPNPETRSGSESTLNQERII